jgi:Protein of unknown function (DUF3090)
MGVFFEFDDVDAFTVGTEGRPGERVFYLQARGNGQRVTLKCEKQQAAAIVQYLRRVLSDLPPPDDKPMPSALELIERGHVRLYVNRGQAAAFCERADDVIEAGRPTCRWCGNPMDLDGHLCARMN